MKFGWVYYYDYCISEEFLLDFWYYNKNMNHWGTK